MNTAKIPSAPELPQENRLDQPDLPFEEVCGTCGAWMSSCAECDSLFCDEDCESGVEGSDGIVYCSQECADENAAEEYREFLRALHVYPASIVAQSRGEIFCNWCWNKPCYAGFWKDAQGNLWCNRSSLRVRVDGGLGSVVCRKPEPGPVR